MEYIDCGEYIRVQPSGYIVNARKCHTLYKSEGWTIELAKQVYGE